MTKTTMSIPNTCLSIASVGEIFLQVQLREGLRWVVTAAESWKSAPANS